LSVSKQTLQLLMKVFIPTSYTYRPAADVDAATTTLEQPSVTVAETREEAPADLDALLGALDSALARLDELSAKDAHFPAELAAIEAKHKTLTDQELDSIEAIQSRSAEMSKIAAMRELAAVRQKRLKSSLTAQIKIVIETGTRAASLLEQRWWANHTRLADEARGEFHRLFRHPFELEGLLASYKPLVLLSWLKVPDFRTGAVDTKLVRCRQLRGSADRLREFERMTFQEVSDELEAQDRESRERRSTKPAGYPA
jgi:hypothetical protein